MDLIPISRIIEEDRQREDYGDIAELAASIKLHGQLQPIVVSSLPDGNVRLIAGGRRLRAHQSLGLATIWATQFDTLSPLDQELIELEENVRRKELTWQELVRSVGRCVELAPSREEACRLLQLHPTTVSAMVTLCEAIKENPKLLTASSWRSAHDLHKIGESKKTDSLLEDILNVKVEVAEDGTIAKVEAVSPASLPGRTIVSEDGMVAATVVAPPPSPTFAQLGSFLDWAPSYEGRRFNLIHCDFPYGLNMQSANLQGSSDRWESSFDGRYEDTPELFDALVRAFFDNQDRFIQPSAHCIFWLAHRNVGKLMSRFSYYGWTPCEVPLIWHKSDNSGIAPDVRRQPRRTYEIAIFAARGDRNIAKVKAASCSLPSTKEHHLSEKPLAVVTHFLEMICDEHSEVLDPTCGSGTALEAALRLGAKRVLGLDVLPSHVTHTDRRCAALGAGERAGDSRIADLV